MLGGLGRDLLGDGAQGGGIAALVRGHTAHRDHVGGPPDARGGLRCAPFAGAQLQWNVHSASGTRGDREPTPATEVVPGQNMPTFRPFRGLVSLDEQTA